ncbi:MAG: hypothetical protein Q9217_003034 [Psora testacea]
MTAYLKGLFGDFADFAGAPDPSPASISPLTPLAATAQGALPTASPAKPIVYTKWYRVWERASPSDFYSEAVILPFMIVIIFLHVWGRRTNKAKANAWIAAHAPSLQKEYALVGFSGQRAPTVEDVQASGLAKSLASDDAEIPEELLKEKSAQEYMTYATGRQNVAFTDAKLTLFKRYNPATLILEFLLSFIFDSFRPPVEKMEMTTYTFDGREKDLVPPKSQEQKDSIEAQAKSKSSAYDQFVWAVVHKEVMKALRDDRYDLSLTSTREHAKLPAWAAVMSESAEVTETLITQGLIKAIESAGDAFEYLIVTDQPLDKPQTLDDTKPRKRLSLSLHLPSGSSSTAYSSTLPIFNYFLRLPDQLASQAHFRPEVARKIRNVRDEEQRKITKASDEEQAEDRRKESEKKKKELRDNKMRGMSAEEQRKFLEKEREREGKRNEKKMSRKA